MEQYLSDQNQLHIFDNDNFSIIPKSIFSDNDNLPISCKNANISAVDNFFDNIAHPYCKVTLRPRDHLHDDVSICHCDHSLVFPAVKFFGFEQVPGPPLFLPLILYFLGKQGWEGIFAIEDGDIIPKVFVAILQCLQHPYFVIANIKKEGCVTHNIASKLALRDL